MSRPFYEWRQLLLVVRWVYVIVHKFIKFEWYLSPCIFIQVLPSLLSIARCEWVLILWPKLWWHFGFSLGYLIDPLIVHNRVRIRKLCGWSVVVLLLWKIIGCHAKCKSLELRNFCFSLIFVILVERSLALSKVYLGLVGPSHSYVFKSTYEKGILLRLEEKLKNHHYHIWLGQQFIFHRCCLTWPKISLLYDSLEDLHK